MWALGGCPMTGWATAAYGNDATRGRLGVSGAVALMALLPAALAGLGNAMLRRDRRAVAWAGLSAAVVCWVGFALFVAAFFLTAPEGFF